MLRIATADANLARQEKAIALKEKEVELTERTLEATVKKQAEADKYAKQQEADAITMLNYDIGSNIGFVADQFNKQMDKTIMEAKGEIESFCQNKINSIANAELVKKRDEVLKLENPVDVDDL